MPWKNESEPAELFLSHEGVDIYHAYKNDQIDEGARENLFVTDEWEGEDEAFDVRELSTWVEPVHPPYNPKIPEERQAWEDFHSSNIVEKAIKQAIIEAIDLGLLPAPEIEEEDACN